MVPFHRNQYFFLSYYLHKSNFVFQLTKKKKKLPQAVSLWWHHTCVQVKLFESKLYLKSTSVPIVWKYYYPKTLLSAVYVIFVEGFITKSLWTFVFSQYEDFSFVCPCQFRHKGANHIFSPCYINNQQWIFSAVNKIAYPLIPLPVGDTARGNCSNVTLQLFHNVSPLDT